MVTATRTFYEDGHKRTDELPVHSADHAFHIAKQVWRAEEEAYEVTQNTFVNGGFCCRVLTKEKTIFKIEYHPS